MICSNITAFFFAISFQTLVWEAITKQMEHIYHKGYFSKCFNRYIRKKQIHFSK